MMFRSMSTRKKRIVSVVGSGILLALFFVTLVLNPSILYAHKKTTAHYTIYYTQSLDPALLQRLEQARAVAGQSECFDPTLRLDVCLNDGSLYPRIAERLWGPAFAWGFYDKVVLGGKADCQANWLTLNGYKWNLVQLLAHESTHCYQFHHFGLWHSNPLARYPTWKWEGYAEYVARRTASKPNLASDIDRLLRAEQTDPHGWDIRYADGTSGNRDYFRFLVLSEYCLDVKKLTYRQVLSDTTPESIVRRQMMRWYQREKEQVNTAATKS